jgi:hypothetical protein
MAVSFPRADIFSQFPIQTTRFDLNYRQSFSRDGGGRLTIVDFREPYWQAEFVSAVMSEDDCLDLEAALISLDGMSQSFLATDTRRRSPRNLQPSAFGSPFVSSVKNGGNQVTFSGFSSGAQISQGDKFSVVFDGLHYLFVAVETKTASTIGTLLGLEIRPRFPAVIPTPQPITLLSPTCSMKIDPASLSFARQGGLVGTVTFQGVQSL